MSFAVLSGNPEELTRQAAALTQFAAHLGGPRGRLQELVGAPGIAGDNGITHAFAGSAAHLSDAVGNAQNALNAAASTLLRLRDALEGLDQQARDVQTQIRELEHRGFSVVQALELEFKRNQLHQIEAHAAAKRAVAAAELDALSQQTRLVHRSHGVSGFSRFVHDIGGMASGLVGGVVGTVRLAGGLTVQAIWDPRGAAQHWKQVVGAVQYVGAHPGATGSAVFRAVVRPDLIRSDPAAWLVNIGVMVLGGEVVKGVSSLGKLGDLGGVLEGAGSRLPIIAQAARDLGIGRLLPAFSVTSKLGPSGETLLAVGVPRQNVVALSDAGQQIIDAELRSRGLAAGNVWQADPRVRGFVEEEGIASMVIAERPSTTHLPVNYPRIDLYDRSSRTMTSIKSIDPDLVSYRDNPAGFRSRISSYTDSLSKYDPPRVGNERVDPLLPISRELIIAVPDSGLDGAHAGIIRDVMNQHPGIDVKIIEVRR